MPAPTRAAPDGCRAIPTSAPDSTTSISALPAQFSISERVKLSLLGEVFNIFNHTNIASVNTTAFTYLASGASTTINGASIKCPGANCLHGAQPELLRADGHQQPALRTPADSDLR